MMTPAPWEVDTEFPNAVRAKGRLCIVAFNTHPFTEEANANAHLIAAAQDLLKAAYLVKRGHCWCDRSSSRPLSDAHTIGCEAMRAAIAKAEGRDIA